MVWIVHHRCHGLLLTCATTCPLTQAKELQQLGASLSGEAGAIRRRLGGEASLQALLGQLRAKEEEAAEKLRDLSAYMDDTSARWAHAVARALL